MSFFDGISARIGRGSSGVGGVSLAGTIATSTLSATASDAYVNRLRARLKDLQQEFLTAKTPKKKREIIQRISGIEAQLRNRKQRHATLEQADDLLADAEDTTNMLVALNGKMRGLSDTTSKAKDIKNINATISSGITAYERVNDIGRDVITSMGDAVGVNMMTPLVDADDDGELDDEELDEVAARMFGDLGLESIPESGTFAGGALKQGAALGPTKPAPVVTAGTEAAPDIPFPVLPSASTHIPRGPDDEAHIAADAFAGL